jgi:hypothetical protein
LLVGLLDSTPNDPHSRLENAVPKLQPTVALAAVALLAADIARAAEGTPPIPETGMVLALRGGFGLPVGDATDGTSLGKVYGSKLPLWGELGYRLSRSFSVGGYFQYAFAFPDQCGSGMSCSGSVVRFGVEGIFRILPDATLDPWVGAGIGYEIASATWQQGGTTAQLSLSGFEFFNIQVGASYRLSPSFSLGPYLVFSFAQYSSGSVNGQDGTFGKSAHGWLQYGVCATFDL